MKLRSVLTALFVSVLSHGLTGLSASAAEKVQDDVKLVITADKDSYETEEKIVANICFENNSKNDITDITLESVIPEGYHLSDDCKSTIRSTYLKSGNSLGSVLIIVPDDKEDDAAVKSTETKENNTKELSTQIVSEEKEITVNSEVSESENNNKKTVTPLILVVSGSVLLVAGIVIAVFWKKGRKGGITVLLCITTASSLSISQDVKAAGSEEQSLSVIENISVGNTIVELSASVRYTVETEDMQEVVEEYYEDNSEEIVSVEEAEETEEVYTEKEAIKFMAERGFNEYPLTYDFNMDGTYADEAEASADSDEKHPMYQTYFISENGAIWSIFIVGRSVFANPASYNLESDIDAQVLVSETETLTSYTEMGNRFYTTVPKESAIKLKVVDQITSQKLNDLEFEEVMV